MRFLKGTFERRISLANNQEALSLFGKHDENIKFLEKLLPVKLIARGDEVGVVGAAVDVERACQVLNSFLNAIRNGYTPSKADIRYAVDALEAGEPIELEKFSEQEILTTDRGKKIRARSAGQRRYVETMKQCDLVFSIGPAGTGKTYLAMAVAISALKEKLVGRVVMARPAVEAGEKLGFLPGALEEKVHPYLRPLYDALHDFLSPERIERLSERGTLEVVPLAYMRGRTLNNCFVILDEAQNSTYEQMKMFVTRLGFDSKAVVTGDITQIDLSPPSASGLVQVRQILSGVEGVAFSYLTERDVVRHPLVREIVKAYESYEAKAACAKSEPLLKETPSPNTSSDC